MTPRTPLRSSLRKNSTSYRSYVGGGGSSAGGTPTNPTPPDSLSEEGPGASVGLPVTGASRSDSGFVSTSNRVRFSPSPFDKGPGGQQAPFVGPTSGGGAYVTDWSPTHEPSGPGSHRSTPKSPFPMQRHSRQAQGPGPGHTHYITESDLQRDFNLYPQQS